MDPPHFPVLGSCRVSSAEERDDLDRQVMRVVEGANARGLAISEVVKEVGSGFDGKGRMLHRVLADPTVAVIVVERRDRLARFGVEHLESALSATGRRVVVLNPQATGDLVGDMTEVLTWMCARLYGQRAAKDRAARAVAVATSEGAG
ncbi:IS607 family transposase [Micromonospora chersina]|uniref:IS607 family transposase n=1 Tax=Micromonospora chersina TaxID=47854 RepID=UPI00371072C3